MMNKKVNKTPPFTDVIDLVAAATDQAVDERVLPAVDKLDKATRKLEDLHPLLEGIVKRQNGQMAWLVGLTVCVFIIAAVLINHLN
jgi:hypothetical protein